MMMLSIKTLERLRDIITGDSQQSPYKSGPVLIDFFHEFGERDLYGQGFPSRHIYVLDKLKKLNGSDKMRGIVLSAFDYIDSSDFDAEAAASAFNQQFAKDGHRLVIEYRGGWMDGSNYIKGPAYFDIRAIKELTVIPTRLIELSHDSISEHIRKANHKIDSGDYAGAITNAYTLIESLLKHLLSKFTDQDFGSKGDIRQLYSEVAPYLNLQPKGESLESYLKAILEGLRSQIAGLYELANKVSDRHDRKYNPSRHHAKLAINATFCLCDFLIDSYEYQIEHSKNISMPEAAAK